MRDRKKLAKWKRKQLDELLRESQKVAAHSLREIGGVANHKIALSRMGVIVFPCGSRSDAQKKAELFEEFRYVLRSSGAWAYIEVSEAWCAPGSDVRPSQHSDRQEVVIISSVLPSGLDTIRVFDIERTEDGASLGKIYDGMEQVDIKAVMIRNAFEVSDTPLMAETY